MDDIQTRTTKLIDKLEIPQKKARIKELQLQSEDPTFWQDHQVAGEKMKELSAMQKEIEELELLQLLIEEGEHDEAEKLLKKLETLLYFTSEYDEGGAIIAIHAG